MAKMTLFEHKLLKNDPSFDFVKQYIDYINREYTQIKYKIERNWNEAAVSSFFNGKPFMHADYIFARHIADLCGWNTQHYEQTANSKEDFILYPPSLYVQRKPLYDQEIVGNLDD